MNGVSFEVARLVFDDVFALDRFDAGSGHSEARYIITGVVNGIPVDGRLSAERGERTRIISGEKRRGMSTGNTTIARRRSDGTLVEVTPDGSTKPLV